MSLSEEILPTRDSDLEAPSFALLFLSASPSNAIKQLALVPQCLWFAPTNIHSKKFWVQWNSGSKLSLLSRVFSFFSKERCIQAISYPNKRKKRKLGTSLNFQNRSSYLPRSFSISERRQKYILLMKMENESYWMIDFVSSLTCGVNI